MKADIATSTTASYLAFAVVVVIVTVAATALKYISKGPRSSDVHVRRQHRRRRSSGMKDASPPIVADLLLVGGGHAHVHVLKMLGMPKYRRLIRRHGIRVSLIASDIHTPYSGMLPGYVAGHYTLDDIHLDLAKLCRFGNVRLIHAAACRITYNNEASSTSRTKRARSIAGGGQVYCQDSRPPVRFDCLSINIGSAPAAGDHVAQTGNGVVPVKPIANFCDYFESLKAKWNDGTALPDDYTLCVVGGGAGGIELALSMQYHLQQHYTAAAAKSRLMVVTRSTTLLPGHNRRVQAVFARVLAERNISVVYEAEVEAVVETAGGSSSRRRLRLVLSKVSQARYNNMDEAASWIVDDCLWCVTAGVASWLSNATPLATTSNGFVRVQPTYESVSHPGIFVAGDCCHMDKHPRPKAGVFSVRAGPYLVDNLVRYLLGQTLRPHHPQRDFLGIISTGDQYGVASKSWWFCVEGAWIWKWKDWIDRRWMAKYTTELPDLEEMMATMDWNVKLSWFGWLFPSRQPSEIARKKGADVFEAFSKDPMRCGGCGAKVGANTVTRVLASVYQRQIRRAKDLGLSAPTPIDHDDAAIMRLPSMNGGSHGVLIQTIDYFREIVLDPYVFGKIAAVHALGDVHAMAGIPQTALTLAVAPFAADEAVTEDTLTHLLSGVSDVLQDEGVQLVGGHTCEGLELACGLSVQGYAAQPDLLLRKRGGQVGDMIVLTKALGTGALFAADMRAQARGEHVAEAIASMVQSNGTASTIAMRQLDGIRACTDVTGFGLMGHLLEMLMANELDNALPSIGAVLDLRAMPFLRGGLAASRRHMYSTLQQQNFKNRRAVVNHAAAAQAFPAEYPLLFDPQTAGGLLFIVDPAVCDNFVTLLKDGGVDMATVIGRLVAYPESLHNGAMDGNIADDGAEEVCMIGSDGIATGLRVRVRF